jgi:hypothetical protein
MRRETELDRQARRVVVQGNLGAMEASDRGDQA